MKMNWNNYKLKISQALDIFEFDDRILEILKNSVKNNQKIFVAGNGGSAALALHYVCDLSKNANPDWKQNLKRFKAICLSNNIGYITAISNDDGYEEVFRQQLINLASKNDDKVVKAAQYAKEAGLIVIGITGFKGGRLKKICDYSAHVNSDSYEVSEDMHQIFGHFLVCYLREAV